MFSSEIIRGIESVTHQVGADFVPALEIHCSQCKATNVLLSGSRSKRLPPEPIKRIYTNRGWKVDLKKGKHLCPKCQCKREERHTSSTADSLRIIGDDTQCGFVAKKKPKAQTEPVNKLSPQQRLDWLETQLLTIIEEVDRLRDIVASPTR